MNDKTRQEILKKREWLKGYTPAYVQAEATDQQQKLRALPPVKAGKGTKVIPLLRQWENLEKKKSLTELIEQRQSRRKYTKEPLTLDELSYLLWACQGVRKFAGKYRQVTFRNVPSAGSRHCMETYLFVSNVAGLEKGIYHYLAETHELELWEEKPDYEEELIRALGDQPFAGSAPVTFVWSALPYRMEWRYGLMSHKYILLDAGHACENLYLACEAIGLGTCAIGAYDQELMDELLGFGPGPSADEDYECVIYAAPVGKIEE